MKPRPAHPRVRPASSGRRWNRSGASRSGKRLIDVAGAAGVSPQYLSEVERGLKDPSSELLAAITGALGLGVAEIATRVASARPNPQVPVCLAA